VLETSILAQKHTYIPTEFVLNVFMAMASSYKIHGFILITGLRLGLWAWCKRISTPTTPYQCCWCTRLPSYYAYLLLFIVDPMLRCIELFA